MDQKGQLFIMTNHYTLAPWQEDTRKVLCDIIDGMDIPVKQKDRLSYHAYQNLVSMRSSEGFQSANQLANCILVTVHLHEMIEDMDIPNEAKYGLYWDGCHMLVSKCSSGIFDNAKSFAECASILLQHTMESYKHDIQIFCDAVCRHINSSNYDQNIKDIACKRARSYKKPFKMPWEFAQLCLADAQDPDLQDD